MVSYFGGKNKVGEWIYPFIPKNIKLYAEPFAGAMWIYFNLKHDFSDVDVIYNDFNKYMCNMIACAKNYNKLLDEFNEMFYTGELYTNEVPGSENWKKFYRELYYSYNSKNRKTQNFLDEPNFDIPDYHAAALYAFLQNSTFNGCFPNTNSGAAPFAKDKLKLQSFINKLSHIGYQEKLKHITKFENLDFEQFMLKYDSEDAYFYCDPPYAEDIGIKEKGNKRLEWYNSDDSAFFGPQSHERLVNLLKETKAKWSLSYYYFEDLEKWLPKDKYFWVSKEFFRTSATGAKNNSKGEELLIMNYDPTKLELRTPITPTKHKRKSTPKKTKSETTKSKIIITSTPKGENFTTESLKQVEDDFWND